MKMLKTALFAVGIAMMLFFSIMSARAATYVVTKTADTADGVCDADCSLREAIGLANQSNNSDEINFDPVIFSTPQTITLLNGELAIALSDRTTINGPGANLLTISGNNQSRIFFSNYSGTFLTISNMTLTDGFSDRGGAIFAGAMTTLSNLVISGNKASGVAVTNQQTGGFGGGVFSTESLVIVDSIISENEASGIAVISPGGQVGGTSGYGGGLYSNSISVQIANCKFLNNVAKAAVVSAPDAIINGSVGFGGAIAGGGVDVFNSTFDGNSAIGGDGVRAINGITGNGGAAWGGALYTSSSKILNSLFINNRVVAGKGGTVAGNGGNAYGGAIYDRSPKIANTTVIGNNATSAVGFIGGDARGGGIYAGEGQWTIVNCTITGNSLTSGLGTLTNGVAQGGGVFAEESTSIHSFDNNIVSENTSTSGTDVFGSFSSPANNLVGVGEPTTGIVNGTNSNQTGTTASPLSAGLGPLADNGGFTLSRAPLGSSPGINAGRNISAVNPITGQSLPFDLRGRQRVFPVGGVIDIGALEFGATTVSAASVPDLLNTSDTGFNNSDNITRARTADLIVSNLIYGARIELLRNGQVVASKTATSTFGSLLLTDPAPPEDGVVVYSSRQNFAGDVGTESGPLQVTFDNTAPSLTINQAATQVDPTRFQPVTFTITLSEPTAGISNSRISFAGSTANTSNAIVNVNFQTSTVYSVTVQNVQGNFQKIIASVPALSINDLAGNPNIASTSTDNAVTLDNVAPTVTINQAVGQLDPATRQPLLFSVLFSENVSGFEANDVVLTGSTANVSAAQITVTGNGTSYTVSVSNVTSRGTVRASIPVARVTDAVGNFNFASTSSDNTINFSFGPGFADFDGDGRTDIGIFRPTDGSWWYSRSSSGDFRVFSFGISTDIMVPADYTGDGLTDIAIFRPASGEWFVQRSEDNSYFSFPFGTLSDVPARADYDGDGKADAAVYRPSNGTWYISNSGGSGTSIIQFGSAEDKPVPADYDGDGKSDLAIFRPSDGSWWYLRSSDQQFRVYRFGLSTDIPVQGDYTGDGKADIAIFRPSTGEWYFQRSEDNSFYSVPFGTGTDIPSPGDYDGDGKFDTAVFRPSTADWFVNRSTAGILIANFGAAGDRPIPNSYVP